MKFNCGPTSKEKRLAKEQWHKRFAWYPIRTGPRECRWLEYIERKGSYHPSVFNSWWSWEYR